MRKPTRRHLLSAFLLALAAMAGWWCFSGKENSAVHIQRVDFTPGKVKVTLGERARLTRLAVRNAHGIVAAEQRYAGVKRQKVDIPMQWSPGERYVLEIQVTGYHIKKKVRAPLGKAPGLWLDLIVPYDGEKKEQDPRPFSDSQVSSAAIAGNVYTTCALLAKNYLRETIRLRGGIELPRGMGLEIDNLPVGVRLIESSAGKMLNIDGVTLGEQEILAIIFKIRLPKGGAGRIKAQITCDVKSGKRAYEREINIHPLDPKKFASMIMVEAAHLPTGRTGYFDSRKKADTIYYKPQLYREITRWLGIGDDRNAYWLPYTYQSLTLRNNSEYDLGLLIDSKIEYLHQDQVPPPFRPPDLLSGAMKNHSVTVSLGLGAGDQARAVLPVYVRSPPNPGQYKRIVTITPMGSQAILAKLEYPLYVSGMNLTALGFTSASCFLSLIAFSALAVCFKPLLAGLKVRWVVIIALFGSLTFVGVNLPLRVFGSLIYGLLGPFGVLILGFFNDLLYFTLLVAVVRLIPRPGVVSLIILVRYLLSVMLTGGFQLSDFLYMGTSIMVKEAAFWLAGPTRQREEFSWSWQSTLFLAVFLGMGDAFLNASSLYIHMVLYRLYFADWFIWLNVAFNGVLYTMIGVFMGRAFSRRLVWVEE